MVPILQVVLDREAVLVITESVFMATHVNVKETLNHVVSMKR